MTPLNLFGSVGYDEDNDPSDVANTGTALATLGHFDALGAVQSGRFDDGLDGAIRTYQTDNDLEPDGVLLPQGPTQQSVNEALKVHRPGPSLLPASAESDDGRDETQIRGSEERNWFGESPSTTRSAPGSIRAKTSEPTISRWGDDADAVVPRIPDVARRDVGGATTPANGVVASIAKAVPKLLDPRENVDEFEQMMKGRGYRYIPDPMGRIGEGDWADEHGRRLTADEASQAADRISSPTAMPPASPERRSIPSAKNDTVTIVPARPGVPPRRIESNFDRLAYDLDTATAYVKRGDGNVRIAVPTPQVENAFRNAEAEVPRINIAIREAVIANALRHRPTGPDEIASVVKEVVENPTHGPQTGRSRIKDMLIEAATNGATPEQRLHARGLLAVYEAEEREAKAAGAKDPQSDADVAIGAFGSAMNADVSWSVFDPDAEDEAELEPANDDPTQPRKPRGMHDPRVRNTVIEGNQRDRELKDRVRGKPGWNAKPAPIQNRKTGGWLRPDVQTRKGYYLELKPNTVTGRIRGKIQCAIYTALTNNKCRVIYYEPSTRQSMTPSTPNDSGRSGTNTRSRGSMGGPILSRPAGIGSNRPSNPKLSPILPTDTNY